MAGAGQARSSSPQHQENPSCLPPLCQETSGKQEHGNQAADGPGQLGALSFLVLPHLSCVSFCLLLTEEILSSSWPCSRIFEEEGGCYHLLGQGRGLK